MRYPSMLAIALAAFTAGLVVAQHIPRADADDTVPIVAQAVDLTAIGAVLWGAVWSQAWAGR